MQTATLFNHVMVGQCILSIPTMATIVDFGDYWIMWGDLYGASRVLTFTGRLRALRQNATVVTRGKSCPISINKITQHPWPCPTGRGGVRPLSCCHQCDAGDFVERVAIGFTVPLGHSYTLDKLISRLFILRGGEISHVGGFHISNFLSIW
jgi:hypothetical protein